jgi:hypothetical protein
MKTIKTKLNLIMVSLVLLLAAPMANAFYMAEAGRWITRDPLGEAGFEAVRIVCAERNSNLNLASASSLDPSAVSWSSRGVWGDAQNFYMFVKNRPINAIDFDGLKCVLMANGMVVDTDKQQVVFWSSDPVATANFIAACNFKKNWPVIGACLLLFGYDPGPGEETCSLARETMGYCIYKCPSGATRVTVAGPYGCWDTKNFPKPAKDDPLFPAK